MINKPRLITRRAVIKSTPARWRKQYFHNGSWGTVCGRGLTESAEVIYKELMSLSLDTVKRSVVDKVIGNTSWTEITCAACRRDAEAAVEVGEAPDYESNTAVLCARCLDRAVTLLETA